LHYNYHRYYDPGVARYGSDDPLGLRGGADPSVYVLNPCTWIDPLGLAPYKILYHGSPNFQGTEFSLQIAQSSKQAGTPLAGIHLTDDFTRAATGYGRGGHVVRVQVPAEFAERIRQLGGPLGNQPEYFVNTPEGIAVLNEGITDILPTGEAIARFFGGKF